VGLVLVPWSAVRRGSTIFLEGTPDTDPVLARLAWLAPIGVAIGALAQRGGLHVDLLDAVLVLAAVAPFAVINHGWQWPSLVIAVAVAVPTAALLSVHPAANDMGPFFLLLAALYGGARDGIWPGVLALAVSIATMVGLDLADQFYGSVVWPVAIAFGWLIGLGARSQERLLSDLRDAQAGLAERAAGEERRRIAREIHDVIAHSLTVTMLHVTGARMALRHDPDDAEAALLEAERIGRQSLADFRRTVGLLAGDADAADAPPQPTAADLATLVSAHVSAGQAVDLEVTGDPAAVPAPAGLALYRIAQEALTNAARHASGESVHVALLVGSRRADLVVENATDATDPARGHREGGLGLENMRERAELVDGRCTAGSNGNGRWTVRAEVPLA
jgi:signal transduction histidine kinase